MGFLKPGLTDDPKPFTGKKVVMRLHFLCNSVFVNPSYDEQRRVLLTFRRWTDERVTFTTGIKHCFQYRGIIFKVFYEIISF